LGASQLRVSDGRGAGSGGISQAARGAAPVFGGWAGRGHGDLDAAHGDAHQRTDLEELEADVPQVALAKAVSARAMRRIAQIST